MAEPSQSNLRKKCQFVVQTKKRPCRMMALAGELFCGEHIVLHPESIVQKPYPNNQIRIKCPLDPRHTCFLHKLDSHLKVCNAREKPRPPYHVRDLNAGDDTPQPDGQTIHELSDKQLLGLLDKITALYKEYVSPPEVADEASHEALAESLEDPTFGANTLKHLRQNSALLAVLRDAGQLPGPQTTFIELGSGKAQLSFWLARAVSSQSQIVLVDFASHRHKAENKLKDLKDMPEVQRLKIDIRHLSLSGCDQCRDRPVTLFSKHLCGAATDYGLRCATAVPPPASAENAAPGSGAELSTNAPSGYQAAQQSANQATHQSGDQPAAVSRGQTSPANVRCVMIAVCCHHRVDWASYVGKHFLQDVCGFSPSDFTALKGVAAWATCGTRSWDEDPRLHGPKPRRGKRPTSPGDGDDGKRRRRSGDEAAAETGEQAEAKTGDGDGKEQTKTGDGGEQAKAKTGDGDEQAKTTPEKGDGDGKEQAKTGDGGEQVTAETAARQGDGDGKATSQPTTETDNGQTNKPEEDEDRPGPGSRDASAGRYQRLGLTPERRTDVGFQCKRLLDEGRRRFLQERGFTARLVRYVPPDVSPENVLLLATR